MDPLEEYIQGDYRTEKQEIDTIDRLIDEVWPLFGRFLHSKNGWPYEITAAAETKVKSPSSSTNAMILFIIAQLRGRVAESELLPLVMRPFSYQARDGWSKMRRSLDDVFRTGLEILLGSIQPARPHLDSGSFGEDDPFTYAWTMTILQDAGSDDTLSKDLKDRANEQLALLQQAAGERIKDAFDRPGDKSLKLEAQPEARRGRSTDHMFPLLRFAHLHAFLRRTFSAAPEVVELEKFTIVARERFLARLHEQLSLYAVVNASFDVAELVFAMEGYLVSLEDRRGIDRHLVGRVFEVLRDAQKHSAYWRPLKPFITTPQGYALLPLSVEIANSLLRISSRLPFQSPSYFSEFVDLFRCYSAWLCTRVTRGTATPSGGKEPQNFTGWHSEHVYVPNRIHPWETSQVASFLLHYREMLHTHVAYSAMAKANLDVKPAPPPQDSASKTWTREELEAELLKFEPISVRASAEPHPFALYPAIIDKFVLPRVEKPGDARPANQSMLLYGPPGTGKSTVPEEMSKILRWPLITITPSDFIARGESEVESRAKLIFKTLEEQTNVIVLFDEIDRLILDRDSKYYHDQNDMFQFMTPSMLIKLKDLRTKGRLIFVIATNYEERIDNAATRKGRVDFKFLIAPPDRKTRLRIIRDELAKALKKTSWGAQLKEADKEIDPIVQGIVAGECEAAAGDRTALMTYGELKGLVAGSVALLSKTTDLKAAGDPNFAKTVQTQLIEDSHNADQPAIRLTTYLQRFRKEEKSETKGSDQFPTVREPLTEFFVLLAIRLETTDSVPLSAEEQEVISRAFGRIVRGGLEAKRTEAELALADLLKDRTIVGPIIAKYPP